MKKLLAILLLLGLTFTMQASYAEMPPLKVVCDFVVELPPYTELDYDFADEYISKNYDTFSMMCSAVTKVIDGKTVIGRNVDMVLSNKPGYIIRTKGAGKYDTIGLSYLYAIGPSFYEVLTGKMTEDYWRMLPFTCSDVMNSNGLYIEFNMRLAEYNEDGTSKFACSGTNPASDKRVSTLQLPRYVAENCGNVREALEYIQSLDIYFIGEEQGNGLSYMMADAEGNYGVLEIANNEVIWLDREPVQTNFYLTEENFEKEDYKLGVGRFAYLRDHYDQVDSENALHKLMFDVGAGKKLNPKECKYDPRSELAGMKPRWTTDYLLDQKNRFEVLFALQKRAKELASSSIETIRMNCNYNMSIFSVIANCTDKTFKVYFYENENLKYEMKF